MAAHGMSCHRTISPAPRSRHIDPSSRLHIPTTTTLNGSPGVFPTLLPGEEGMRVLIVGGAPGRPYEAPSFREPEQPEVGA
jgi:hypothetical protein